MGHLRGGCQCASCGLVCREARVVGGVKWQRVERGEDDDGDDDDDDDDDDKDEVVTTTR
jgi:hypothetical protein